LLPNWGPPGSNNFNCSIWITFAFFILHLHLIIVVAIFFVYNHGFH
jgi:hypothetical protein